METRGDFCFKGGRSGTKSIRGQTSLKPKATEPRIYERPDFIPVCDDKLNLGTANIESDGQWFCDLCHDAYKNGPRDRP